MQLVVVDTETTGLKETDQVCEMAVATIGTLPAEGGRTNYWLERAWGTFIKPTCEMSLAARAVHHISDETLAAAPTMTELLLRRGLPEFGHSPLPTAYDGTPPVPDPFSLPDPTQVVLVAHNAEFDRRLLVQSGIHPDLLPARTICTYKCALHLWPDSDSHKNGFLRYYLGVEPAFDSDEPPHRALADVAVTAAILGRMLQTHTPEQLVELTQMQVLQRWVRFGKYYGQLWKDMDEGFLRWVLQRGFNKDVKHAAHYWLAKKTGWRK